MAETQTAIILATDLVGSTAQRSALGEEAAEELRRRHDAVLRAAVVERGGTVVKSLGDGILARFAGAADAVAAAVAMQQAAGDELALRVGISAGDVTLEDGDCFGTPVIEACRLCDRAGGGQVLVADLARLLARGRGGHVFRSVGDLDLKGLPDPVGTSEVAWEPIEPHRVPFPQSLRATGGFPFAGRAQVVEQLSQVWKHAVDGAARVLLLSGEPGVGKTRLAAELASAAYAGRATVLFGRSDEEVTSPYRPFAEALAPLVGHLPDDVLAEHAEAFAGALAVVAPGLRSRVTDVLVPDGSAEEIRAIVFDAVADVLVRAGRLSPLFVVLDDLHWADEPSLLLLKHLARHPELGRVLIVGTYRDTDLVRGHRLGSVLADLRRVDTVERIALEGLDQAEVVELMAAAGGHELDERALELARIVHHETEGNPFFVGEVLAHLAESGAIYESDGRWVSDVESVADLGVPQGIREVVGRRLDALTDDANAALRTAAVVGMDFAVGVLAGALGRPEDEVIDLLDDALARGLIVEVPGRVDRLRFAHALVRQTLYEEISASRRARIHARVAAAYDASTRPAHAERAHHMLEAAAVADSGAVVAATVAAAEDALGSGAWETAQAWLERGLDAIADAGEERPALRAGLLSTMAKTRFEAGDYLGARDAVVEAAEMARRGDDPHLLADLACTYAFAGTWLSLGDSLGLDLVTEAEARLPEGESAARAELLVARASLSWMSPDGEAVTDAARRGLAMVRATSSNRLPAALLTLGNALRGSPRADELGDIAAEMRTTATDQSGARRWGLYFEMLARLKQGRITDVERLAGECHELAGRSRTPNLDWAGHLGLAGAHLWRARWDDARQEIDRMAEVAGFMGDTGIVIQLTTEGFVRTLRGDALAATAAYADLADRLPLYATLARYDAVVGAQTGSIEPAELGAAAANWLEEVHPHLPHWLKHVGLGAMAGPMRHAPADVAARALVAIEPSADVWLTVTPPIHEGHCGWTIGALAEARGDLDRAVAECTRAADAHATAGEIPMRAHRLLWLAEVLLERDGPGDAERAKRLADEIATAADRHHILGLADRATALVP
jgi:hypothetical protein